MTRVDAWMDGEDQMLRPYGEEGLEVNRDGLPIHLT